MRKTVAAMLILYAAAIGLAQGPDDGAIKVGAGKATLEIQFPGKPKEKDVGDTKSYSLDAKGNFFLALHKLSPGDAREEQARILFLQARQIGVISDGKVLRDKEFLFAGKHRALDHEFQHADGKITRRIIIIGPTHHIRVGIEGSKEFADSEPAKKFLASLKLPGQADDKKRSPDEVFQSFAAALKKDDAKAGMAHLTGDSQTAFAGTMVVSLVVGKMQLDKDIATTSDGKERLQKIEDTLKRHGLNVEGARDHVEKEFKTDGIPDNKLAIVLTLGAMVKDKPALVADVLKFSHYGNAFASLYGFKDRGNASIKPVKIDGKQATGAATFIGADGKEISETVYFKLEDGVWKIDGIETVRNRPPPPPDPPRVETPMPRNPPYEPQRGPVRRLLQRLRGG